MFAGTAHAATLSVTNSDFQSPYNLPAAAVFGNVGAGAAGWQSTGSAGTFQPYDMSVLFSSWPAEIGDRIAYIDAGASLFQSLGVTIEADISYSLSALFGHRSNRDFGGLFGFFAGDSSNIIATTPINDPGSGLWGSQTSTLDTALLSSFIGQELGIIFLGVTTQVNFDNVEVYAGRLDDGQVLVNPLPGAAWLFGTALVGGAFARRRSRKAAVAG